MLSVRSLNAYYGHVHAVKGISFEVNTGEIFAVLGPNGAGKTTLIRALAGLAPPQVKGGIAYQGMDITGLRTEKRVSLGITAVLEGRRIFPELTVRDNLLLGAYRLRRSQVKVKQNMEFVQSLFPVLAEKERVQAGFLSGGEQQMLAIGRALMAEPELLLLDEPSFGLAPKVVANIFDVLIRLKQEKGMTIILVEQDALLALKHSDKALVIAAGRPMLQGSASELLKDKKLLSIYLGGSQHENLES